MRLKPLENRRTRFESIDVLRGIVMIIMALDHVRDYFHRDAFVYSPTDLTQTSVVLFFTRWITHYCAPVFVFLAGISAHLYGTKKTKAQLARFLFTRGLWLVFAEFFIISFAWTFNPAYKMFNLQVIFAIGVSMMVLSALVFLPLRWILVTGIAIVAGHNLLDNTHIPGSMAWAILHEPNEFTVGNTLFVVRFPVLAWIGIMAIGYCMGLLFTSRYDADKRRTILLSSGLGAIVLFIILRAGNFYGDAAYWTTQKNMMYSFLSFLNTTKYPPSLLYTLMTLGPALLFLGLGEKPLTGVTGRIAVFGRVPFFYYVLHIMLIHFLALFGAAILDYNWTDMILSNRVYRAPGLKGYGYGLSVVYFVWISLVLILYPLCRWFDRYKRSHLPAQWWLSYM